MMRAVKVYVTNHLANIPKQSKQNCSRVISSIKMDIATSYRNQSKCYLVF